MKNLLWLVAVLFSFSLGATLNAAAQTPTPIPNDPACLDAARSRWLDIINARATLQRLFSPQPPTPLTSEVTILFVGTPLKSHQDMNPHIRGELEINLNEDGSRPDDVHETAVASTAVAKTQNAFGVCSVAGDGGVTAASAIIVDNSGLLTGERARRAIRYAIDKKKAGFPVEIIAMAFAGGDDPHLTEPLIQEADASGIIIVAAAGTTVSPRNLDEDEVYPAAYSRKFRNVVTVTALNPEGTALDATANRGVRTVQLAAAGQVTVVSFLDPQNGGAGASGSSMGVGQVAGALALIKRYKERDHHLAIDRLLFAASAAPVSGVGYGKLDVDRAYNCGPGEDAPELVGRWDNPARAAALNAATFIPEPFSLTNDVGQVQNLSADKRTRLLLEVLNLQPGDSQMNVGVRATDALGQTHQLGVEAVGKNPGSACLTQVNVVLPAHVASGDARFSVSARGKTGSAKLVKIQ